MSIVSSVIRVKLAIFAVICFVLWQALRTVPNISSFSYDDPSARLAHTGPGETPIVAVEVTVFYEALCPDSRSFVIKQLLPTYENAAHLINPVLVPYGKAQTQTLPGGGYTFTCQHGPLECQANKIHACVIEKVKDKATQLKYIACMINNNMDPEGAGEKCAKRFGVPWEPILQCSTGIEGDELLKQHGDATNALSPGVSFIPTILLNKSQDNQAGILKNLLREVCNLYQEVKPPECS